jgi:glucose/arabinose dehydrogenase
LAPNCFDNDGYLYFSIGERGEHFVNPQDLKRDGGKIYRLNDDGSIPKDNPLCLNGAKEAIYTYGNRNPQGIAKNPQRELSGHMNMDQRWG